MLQHEEITYLIFNDELSANQLKNITKEIDLEYLKQVYLSLGLEEEFITSKLIIIEDKMM